MKRSDASGMTYEFNAQLAYEFVTALKQFAGISNIRKVITGFPEGTELAVQSIQKLNPSEKLLDIVTTEITRLIDESGHVAKALIFQTIAEHYSRGALFSYKKVENATEIVIPDTIDETVVSIDFYFENGEDKWVFIDYVTASTTEAIFAIPQNILKDIYARDMLYMAEPEKQLFPKLAKMVMHEMLEHYYFGQFEGMSLRVLFNRVLTSVN